MDSSRRSSLEYVGSQDKDLKQRENRCLFSSSGIRLRDIRKQFGRRRGEGGPARHRRRGQKNRGGLLVLFAFSLSSIEPILNRFPSSFSATGEQRHRQSSNKEAYEYAER